MDRLRDRLQLYNYSFQLDHVRRQLAAGEDPNQKDGNGYTPLHRAIIANLADNVKVIEEYIKAGADVNLRTAKGFTALHFAISHRKTAVVEVLLRSGASVNTKDEYGRSALHLALLTYVLGDRYKIPPDEIIMHKLLIHEDIDCNAVNSEGETPLMVAVKKKEFQAMKKLLRHYPNPNICNQDLDTPLHVAFATHSMCAEPLLVLMGADICCLNQHGKSPFDIFIRKQSYWRQEIWAMHILRTIAFQYNITDILMEKLYPWPALRRLLHRCSREVLKMRTDFISPKLTVHDFLLKCWNENQFQNPLLQIYQPIVERLNKDDYYEYFRDILETIPRDSLLSILVTTAALRQVEDNANPSVIFFSRRFKVDLISKFLNHLDVFSLFVAFTKNKIPKSLVDLHKRSMSVRLELP